VRQRGGPLGASAAASMAPLAAVVRDLLRSVVVDSIGGQGCMVLLGRCWLRLTSAWLGRMSSISS
jgi:hypothetical protein